MTRDDEHAGEIYPIAYSTAYLALAALLTIRNDDTDTYDDEARDYAAAILRLIQAQPETVLTLPPSELEKTGPMLLDNASTWLT